jgi:hypothetical protein
MKRSFSTGSRIVRSSVSSAASGRRPMRETRPGFAFGAFLATRAADGLGATLRRGGTAGGKPFSDRELYGSARGTHKAAPGGTGARRVRGGTAKE